MPTAALAAFAVSTTSRDLPLQTRTRLQQCLLDTAGVTVAGARLADSSEAIIAAITKSAGIGTTAVLGTALRLPPGDAALLNGTFAHSLDFDDTHIASGLHPGAAVVSAAFAALGDADGEDLTAALAVGYEVSCRVGAALGHGCYRRGFHPTAIAGIFGAVTAAARLQHLTADEMVSAYGLAGSMAAGSMQYLSNGGHNKRLHPGLAARNALLACDIAASGVLGAASAFEGALGVLHSYTEEPSADALSEGLGATWLMDGTGIKPYPSCRLTHGAIDAALAIRTDTDLANPIRLAISPGANMIVGGDDPRKREPRNSVDGQFSVIFQAAAALLDGRLDWSSYGRLADPDVRDLLQRIELSVDGTLPEAGAVLTIGSATVRVEDPSGEPGSDLSWDLVEAKFHGLTAPFLDAEARGRAVTLVRESGSPQDLVRALIPTERTR
jgi:2-methylcitrate dehydratase PrpD